jgi:hypothetical protein
MHDFLGCPVYFTEIEKYYVWTNTHALFTSRVFEGIRGDYLESQKIPNSSFTTPGFGRIIPRYPHNSPPILMDFCQ